MALTCVKFNEFELTFNLLKNGDSFPSVRTPLYDYFFDIFIGINNTASYIPAVFHFLESRGRLLPRTNNGIEGWHNTFACTFGTSIYSFTILIHRLQNEEDVFRTRSIQIDSENSLLNGKIICNSKIIYLHFQWQGRQWEVTLICFFLIWFF